MIRTELTFDNFPAGNGGQKSYSVQKRAKVKGMRRVGTEVRQSCRIDPTGHDKFVEVRQDPAHERTA
jgi:hypothetical protein